MSTFSREHVSAIIGVVISIVGALVSLGQIYLEKQERQESLVYEKQLESLNNIEGSIDALREFVKNQKENLKTSQIAIKELEGEREKLKPVVEADRKVVDALFQLQAEKQKQSIWLDRAGSCRLE